MAARRRYEGFALAVAANAAFVAISPSVKPLPGTAKSTAFAASPIVDGWHTGGPFVGHNALAAYLNLGLALSLGLLLSPVPGGRRQGHGVLAGCFAAVTAAGVLASAFSEWVCRVAGIARGRRVRGSPTARRATAAFAAGSAIVGLVLYGLIGSNPDEPIGLARGGRRLQRSIRNLACRAGGVGGSTLLRLGTRDISHGGRAVFCPRSGSDLRRAENEYLDILTEGGLAGLGLVPVGNGRRVAVGLRGIGGRRGRWHAGQRWRSVGGGSGTRFLTSRRETALVAGGPGGFGRAGGAVVGRFQSPYPRCGDPGAGVGRASGRAGARTTPGAFRTAWSALGLAWGRSPWDWRQWSGKSSRVPAPKPASPVPGCRRPAAAVPVGLSMTAAVDALSEQQLSLKIGVAGARPDWAEGHLRLGLTWLALYQRDAASALAEEVADPAMRDALADPLVMHAAAHGEDARVDRSVFQLLPVRTYLVPATRCFLEARRCDPRLAPAHARLATLDYLVEDGESTSIHAGRAMALAGADGATLALAARAAAQGGELKLAAEAWRRVIEADQRAWEKTVDSAVLLLDSRTASGRRDSCRRRLAVEVGRG